MNEQMKQAWLEISQMLGEPTREELDVFLRTWQRAIQAEREECAKLAMTISEQGLPEEMPEGDELFQACKQIAGGVLIADAIRARGNT